MKVVKRDDAASVRLVQTLVVVAMASGLINLLPTPFMAATVLIDGVCVLMLVGALVLANKRGGRVEAWMLLAVLAVLVSLALTAHGSESPSQKLLAVRYAWLYVAPAFFIPFAVRSRTAALAIVRTIMGAGLAMACFGCVQFVFRASLPTWLLFSRDTKLFGYWGTDITRSTGLVGNSIVYGTLATLVFVLWAAAAARPRMSRRARGWTCLAAVICALGVLASFSRVAIASSAIACIVILVVGAWSNGVSRAIPVLLPATLIVAIVGVWGVGSEAVQRLLSESFIVQGLFGGTNASVAGSTGGHDLYTRLALDSFAMHPWVGIGLGSQSQASEYAASSVVITDGFHLSTLVEGGLFLFVPTSLFLISVAVRALVARRQTSVRDRWLPLGVALFLVSQLAIAGFYNTGFYGKVPNVVFWTVFGVTVALCRPRRSSAPSFSDGFKLREGAREAESV